MDLFAGTRQKNLDRVAPLAARMRPRNLDEFVGQQHFLGAGKLLRRMLEADRLTSVLFYGPPGTGKTSLASLIAAYTESHFEKVNAAGVGVKEVRAILDAARAKLEDGGKRTVLFIDEIHRFNRSQQDILLSDVEAGLIILIGATTENPFFAVNSALVSRSQIFQFQAIINEDIKALLKRAIADEERGFGRWKIEIDEQALDLWAEWSDGDARRGLGALEVAVLSAGAKGRVGDEALHIDVNVAEQSMQRKAIAYDGTGDEHYDAVSALIKSMRGSDPDAAIYWIARMLEAGEDPRFIARRIAILASEDVGMADSRAMLVAQAAYDLVERIGMPEAQLILAHAAIYMATAPKSNSVTIAIGAAMKDAKEGRTIPVPKHLRDGHYPGSKRLGHGEGYEYAHNHTDSVMGGFVAQDYLGVEKTYYVPKEAGQEGAVKQRMEHLAARRNESRAETERIDESESPPPADKP
ncbi:MAG: ATPase, family [Phycisphaerales bacterium]|nr:ATPase, family [Phycisphaerales bacterium]